MIPILSTHRAAFLCVPPRPLRLCVRFQQSEIAELSGLKERQEATSPGIERAPFGSGFEMNPHLNRGILLFDQCNYVMADVE